MNGNLQTIEISEPIFRNHKAVSKYLSYCQKSKRKRELLYPKVCEIFENEIKNIEWIDDCFCKHLMKMLSEAHVSQLQSFFCRYNHSAKKTVFFLRFVKDEL